MNSQSVDLLNPEKNIGLDNWNIVNDDVMGGISTSYLSVSDEKNLIFNGNLSLENNGGFASSRLGLKKNILKGVKSFIIRIKGDGNSISSGSVKTTDEHHIQQILNQSMIVG